MCWVLRSSRTRPNKHSYLVVFKNVGCWSPDSLCDQGGSHGSTVGRTPVCTVDRTAHSSHTWSHSIVFFLHRCDICSQGWPMGIFWVLSLSHLSPNSSHKWHIDWIINSHAPYLYITDSLTTLIITSLISQNILKTNLDLFNCFHWKHRGSLVQLFADSLSVFSALCS